MTWKEVKSWATKNGYDITRFPIDNENNKYEYIWNKETESGKEYSTFELVKLIYNRVTKHKYIEHQQNYIPSDIEIKPQ